MRVVHICNAPLAPDHPDYGRVSMHPGRWTLNLAVAQKTYCDVIPELVVQVPAATRNHDAVIETIPVHYLAAPDRFRSATFFTRDRKRIANYVRTLKPDLVHAHGTEDAYGLAAQSTGFPYVITAQGLFFHINRAVRPKLLSRQRIVQFTEAFCLRRARHVVAKSRYVREALAAKFPHLQLHEIPNTFDQRLLEIRETKRPDSLVFVGTISPWKGVHTLREALVKVGREIPGVTLDVVGDSTNSALPYEIEQKRLLQQVLGDRVTFHGQLGVMELGRLVASSMALVAPSLEDMFGNQLVEALLLQTHGIVAEGTALPENVRRFGNGTIVPREDPEGLANAILKVLTGPISEAKAQQTREAVAAALAPSTVANLHYQVYEQVLRE
jgi:glycosyltransferase involved in cell wall biosynthesis